MVTLQYTVPNPLSKTELEKYRLNGQWGLLETYKLINTKYDLLLFGKYLNLKI